jgi:hypothetical protein
MMNIKVRIACVVGADGLWNSCGWNGIDDDQKMTLATEEFNSFPQAEYWIEIELPIPEQTTVTAKVTENE